MKAALNRLYFVLRILAMSGMILNIVVLLIYMLTKDENTASFVLGSIPLCMPVLAYMFLMWLITGKVKQ
jgi:intergrase/recombinase